MTTVTEPKPRDVMGKPDKKASPDLTPRQRQITALLIAGRSVTSIATQLHCTEATVRNHIADIAAKINSPHPPMRRILMYGPDLLSEGS